MGNLSGDPKAANTGRVVKPDGKKIKSLRRARGWDVSEMASQAGCSLKTVLRLESGKNCYIFTLARFAAKLKVQPSELMIGDMPQPAAMKSAVTVRMTITNIQLENIDETIDLLSILADIKRRLGVDIKMEPKDIKDCGSIEITVEMSEEDALLLAEGYVRANQPNVVKAVAVPGSWYLKTTQTGGMPISEIHLLFLSEKLEAALDELLKDIPMENIKSKRDEESGRKGAMGA